MEKIMKKYFLLLCMIVSSLSSASPTEKKLECDNDRKEKCKKLLKRMRAFNTESWYNENFHTKFVIQDHFAIAEPEPVVQFQPRIENFQVDGGS